MRSVLADRLEEAGHPAAAFYRRILSRHRSLLAYARFKSNARGEDSYWSWVRSSNNQGWITGDVGEGDGDRHTADFGPRGPMNSCGDPAYRRRSGAVDKGEFVKLRFEFFHDPSNYSSDGVGDALFCSRDSGVGDQARGISL